jgi:hypothetical protein
MRSTLVVSGGSNFRKESFPARQFQLCLSETEENPGGTSKRPVADRTIVDD